ncbi:hypothetical protein ANN_08147 [Periplaneta americana]|uniref:HTH psq-type domain-containing protein n=1 Tax=Periplaneta americana TaxID=6978 RepID=A0ABQ8T1U2_PERAM|nr:hypothetical protein ANN_08147 [Periplaneta americana]
MKLFSADGIGDSEMILGKMRPRIRHRLPEICFTVGENLGKNRTRELRDIYKDPDIIALIKSRRLRWLGHVLRRDEDSLLRKAFDYSPRCTRPLGRPSLRWQDQVYDNLSTVGGRQEDAENRDEWRYISQKTASKIGKSRKIIAMSSFVHGLGPGNGEQPLWELAAASTNTPVTMSPKRRKLWKEEVMKPAIISVRNKVMGLQRASNTFNVPKYTLKDKVNNKEEDVDKLVNTKLGIKPYFHLNWKILWFHIA